MFPGYKQGAGWEVGQLGLEPVPIWDPGAFKARTLASRPQRWAPYQPFLRSTFIIPVYVLVYEDKHRETESQAWLTEHLWQGGKPGDGTV